MKIGRWAAALLCLVLLAACDPGPAPGAQPVAPSWQEVKLPLPAGQRAVVRGSATCSDRWYLTGSTVTAAGAYSPAVWTSTDLRTWTAIPINPVSFYGKQNTLSLTGCQVGHLASIGWQTGGAHGFPRYSGWYPDAAAPCRRLTCPTPSSRAARG